MKLIFLLWFNFDRRLYNYIMGIWLENGGAELTYFFCHLLWNTRYLYLSAKIFGIFIQKAGSQIAWELHGTLPSQTLQKWHFYQNYENIYRWSVLLLDNEIIFKLKLCEVKCSPSFLQRNRRVAYFYLITDNALRVLVLGI